MLMLSACETFQGLDGTQLPDGDMAQAEQFIRLGDSTRNAGDPESAATLYRRAIDIQPDWEEPLLRLGDVALQLGALGDAELAYRKALALNVNSLVAQLGLGHTLLRLGNHPEALAVFERAITLKIDDGRAYNGAAVALELSGRHMEAMDQYANGIAADPERVSLYNNQGLSMALVGDYGEAIRWLNDVLQSGKGNIQTRQTLALVYGLSGDDESAAKIAIVDLSAEDVQNNLMFYARLRAMSDEERAAAVFGLAWP